MQTPNAHRPRRSLAEPPIRSVVSEFSILLLILGGTLASSILAAMTFSMIPMAFFNANDEGPLFLQPAIMNLVGVVSCPIIFATIASNHCRRFPGYFLPLTVAFWFFPVEVLRRHNLMVRFQWMEVGISAIAGLIAGYWILRRKASSMGSPGATNATRDA